MILVAREGAIAVAGTVDLTKLLVAIANLDPQSCCRPSERDTFVGDGHAGATQRIPSRRAALSSKRGRHRAARCRVQRRPRDGTRPDHTRRQHSGQKPAGRRTAPRGGHRRSRLGKLEPDAPSGTSFSISSERVLIPTQLPPVVSHHSIELSETDVRSLSRPS